MTATATKKLTLSLKPRSHEPEVDQTSSPHQIRYIDLCCGIGGFRVGINLFQQAHPQFQMTCVYSADIKADAIKTYNLNFGEQMGRRDLFDIEELPQFDLLCAGFPCQPFSSAGSKKGFGDKRGGLIFKIQDLCKKYQPQMLILENVSNLLTLENGSIIRRIVSLFEEIGYQISYKKMNSSDFSIPQSRERVYIVGHRVTKVDLNQVKVRPPISLGSIIETQAKYTDIDPLLADKLLMIHNHQNNLYGFKLQDKRGGVNNIHSWDLGYNGSLEPEERELMNQIMTERRKKHWAIEKNITWMDGMPLTYDDISTFYHRPSPDALRHMLDHLVSLKYLKLEKCKDLTTDGQRAYKEDSPEGYNICKGKLSFPISTILDPHGVAPTLTATDCSKLVFIIDNQYIRKMTDIELKQICGFPVDFQIPQEVDKYDLFGNMVCPPVITSILETLYFGDHNHTIFKNYPK